MRKLQCYSNNNYSTERDREEGHRNMVVGVKKKKSGMMRGGKRRTEMDRERETENRAGRKRAIPRDVTRSALRVRGKGNQRMMRRREGVREGGETNERTEMNLRRRKMM